MRIATAMAFALLTGFGAAALAAEPTMDRGEALYRSVCAKCHGEYGRGDGPALEYLTVRPPDLTDPAVWANRTDAQIVAGLQERAKNPATSHSPMTMAGVVKEGDLLAAVHYARTLGAPGRHASLAAGRDIYTSICWSCHGTDGKGDGPAAANLGKVKPRDFTSPEFKIAGREDAVYKTISEGAAKSFHGSESMIGWKGSLTPQQIRDVMTYIQTFQSKPK